uniref:Uncharacterized protein n=1 Tax=Knipowitschia caucasica TaxID=637954 RepID=A0AAV2L9B5_KNICA
MNQKERRQLRRAVEREQERSLTNMEDAGEEVQAEAGPSTSNMEDTGVEVQAEAGPSTSNMEDAGVEVQAEAGPSTPNTESQQDQPEVQEESTEQDPANLSREDLLKERDLLKLRARMEYEDKYRAHFYIATLTSEHKEKMKEKDAIIQRPYISPF